MKCDYCNKELSSLSSLINHKKKAKYCLKIQNELGIISKNKEYYKCYFCFKDFLDKITLTNHLENTCLNDLNVLEVNNTFKNKLNEKEIEKDIEIQKLNDKIYSLEKENIEINKQNYCLKEVNKILDLDHKCIQEIAKQPKNINNNNKTLNLINSLNLSDTEQIKHLIDNNYNLDYIFSGQKGCAKFALENIIKDDNGNLKYICSDPSRFVYKFKDENGNIQKDVDAKKLTNLLVESGIKTKVCNLANEWWTDENGKTNVDKFELLLDKTESIRYLEDDNTEFKKELAAMTTI